MKIDGKNRVMPSKDSNYDASFTILTQDAYMYGISLFFQIQLTDDLLDQDVS